MAISPLWVLQAKELVMRSLPVPESVLKRHCEAIAPISAKKKMQMLQVGPVQRSQHNIVR
jgi:hypothetical protein